jgi:hypothetical protein
MRQIIEYDGQTDAGIDSYVIDGSRKGRHLIVGSVEFIQDTKRKGAPDIHDDKGRGLRIVHIGRATDTGRDQWVEHIEIGGEA